MLAAGCGGSDDKDGGDSDFAKQSGDKIAADAKADMKDLDAVKFSGEITSERRHHHSRRPGELGR